MDGVWYVAWWCGGGCLELGVCVGGFGYVACVRDGVLFVGGN